MNMNMTVFEKIQVYIFQGWPNVGIEIILPFIFLSLPLF